GRRRPAIAGEGPVHVRGARRAAGQQRPPAPRRCHRWDRLRHPRGHRGGGPPVRDRRGARARRRPRRPAAALLPRRLRPLRGLGRVAIYALGDAEPRIDPTAYVHPDAVVIGEVELGPEASGWPRPVLRGDPGGIVVGARTSIQDGPVVHTTPITPTRVGADCVVGHLVHLEGCTIGDGALVGSGSIVLNGAVVEDGAQIAAGAVVSGSM